MARYQHQFRGKAAVITGAGSGIGRATALGFAREGAHLVCSDLSAAAVADTAAQVARLGATCEAIAVDVTRRTEVESMIARAIDRFGAVDFLFNSAGSAIRRARFLEITDELLQQTFDVNVKGTFHAMQAVLPHMMGRGGGVIVNMGSMAHKRGSPGAYVHYAAAKGAVISMTLGVAREVAAAGVRVLSISPGPIATNFQAASQSSQADVQASLNDVPMKRLGRPEEIAELVLFLCSGDCGFMTADTVYVNGGGGYR